ncbi:hypothetical protein [Lactiplantibacillus plajomi]|uniref:Uncharacterized protein n=1 Tax=Lactiplantibacillus plajomi TaxID=1457217 RepID=A0ABV6K466_9LACO
MNGLVAVGGKVESREQWDYAVIACLQSIVAVSDYSRILESFNQPQAVGIGHCV